MALAVMLLIGGRLGDMFGRKRMLLVGVGGFTVAAGAQCHEPAKAHSHRHPHLPR
jgi:MFS family permease